MFNKESKFIFALGSFLVFTTMTTSTHVYAEAQEIKLVMGTAPKDSPHGESLREWGELIKEYSGGELNPKYFYQNELGGQQEVFDLLVAGEIDGVLDYPMTSYNKKIGVIYTPYMFTEWEDAFQAYKSGGWLSGILENVYQEINLKFLGPRVEGFTGITSRNNYAESREDALKLAYTLRTMPVFPIPQTVEAMGYNVASIDWSETYTALQTGVVDGNSNNIIYWDYVFLGDLMDYFTQTNHLFMTAVYSMNHEVFDGLSESNKQAVLRASDEMVKRQFDKAKKEDKHYQDAAVADGVKYIVLSEDKINSYANEVRRRVWPEIEGVLGKDIMNTVKENASEM